MDVYPGAQYTDGLLVVSGTEGAVAWSCSHAI